MSNAQQQHICEEGHVTGRQQKGCEAAEISGVCYCTSAAQLDLVCEHSQLQTGAAMCAVTNNLCAEHDTRL